MGKISKNRRRFKIRAKQKMKEKIDKLKENYNRAEGKKSKEEILKKIIKIAPHYPIERILKQNKKEK